jgi:ribose-phosphate pyrophosphokinase
MRIKSRGFFDVAVDNIYATPVMLNDIQRNQPNDAVVVSPDIGGVVRARAMAKQMDSDLAIIDKRRPAANQAEIMNIIGEDSDRTCLIVDDIVDTAGTLCNAAKALKEQGAKAVAAYCTHPVLSGGALDNLNDSALDELVVTDSIPIPTTIMETGRVRIITIAELLGEAVRRVSNEESISAMFR